MILSLSFENSIIRIYFHRLIQDSVLDIPITSIYLDLPRVDIEKANNSNVRIT
jgi:hypothetical protein